MAETGCELCARIERLGAIVLEAYSAYPSPDLVPERGMGLVLPLRHGTLDYSDREYLAYRLRHYREFVESRRAKREAA